MTLTQNELSYLAEKTNYIFDEITLSEDKLRYACLFPGEIIPNYSWNLGIKLREDYYNQTYYSVYDSNHKFLYSNIVKNNKILVDDLDKQYLEKIKHSDYVIVLFSLDFKKKIIVWIATRLDKTTENNVVMDYLTEIDSQIVSIQSQYQLKVNLSELDIDITKPVTIYYLPSSFNKTFSLNYIKNNQDVQIDTIDYLINYGREIDINVFIILNKSGYLLIEYTMTNKFKNYMSLEPESDNNNIIYKSGIINYVKIL